MSFGAGNSSYNYVRLDDSPEPSSSSSRKFLEDTFAKQQVRFVVNSRILDAVHNQKVYNQKQFVSYNHCLKFCHLFGKAEGIWELEKMNFT